MTTVIATTETKAGKAPKAQASDRAVGENRLGLKLVAPAVVLMLIVTAYPMLQALYLS
ncbi:MAG: sugar ABC transporter permease, partial [Nocardioidaceae bacterium]|nr:sugar ABC transporter permease [Nocardioidaceae bacterium]